MKKPNSSLLSLLLSPLLLLSSCTRHVTLTEELTLQKEQNLTLGLVQKKITIGMSQSDVALALGSPNIVSKDSSEKETWVYDKIASTVSSSEKAESLSLLLAGYQRASKTSSSTQKTLTVLIKFGKDNTVEYISYHSSKF